MRIIAGTEVCGLVRILELREICFFIFSSPPTGVRAKCTPHLRLPTRALSLTRGKGKSCEAKYTVPRKYATQAYNRTQEKSQEEGLIFLLHAA
jgi:hypothetical protein